MPYTQSQYLDVIIHINCDNSVTTGRNVINLNYAIEVCDIMEVVVGQKENLGVKNHHVVKLKTKNSKRKTTTQNLKLIFW